MVVIDAAMLLLLLRPDVGVPRDSEGNPISDYQARLAFWIERMDAAGTKIIIPAPALSEVLVRAGSAGPQLLEQINEYAVFRIAPFDQLEAIEVAAMTKADIDQGSKRGGASDQATWAKIKYDRQIVATARVAQATTIYTDDKDIKTFGSRANLTIIGLADLPVKPLPPQQEFTFEQDSQATVENKEDNDEAEN